MITLILHFPARRYHATPWGHHVNEGQVEWPPSPWRLLRALLSVGYTSGLWSEAGPPPVARSVLEKLAGALPRYILPAATGAHSRHYMPLATFKDGREETTLVFDTWIRIDGGEVAVTWDVVLDEAETRMLSSLVDRLGYLGRSESWVLARLAQPGEALPRGSEAYPCEGTASPGPGWEQVAVLAPMPAQDYQAWRASAGGAAMTEEFPDKGQRRRRKASHLSTDLYPRDLLDCLQKDTRWLQELGWSQPPGSRRVLYWRRADSLEAGAPPPHPSPVRRPAVEAVLLSMATATGNNHALPSVTRTLPQAELLHRALVGAAFKEGLFSRVLTGCDEGGRPLREGHVHGHFLPLDLDEDGHLDHFLLWAPMGLDWKTQVAIRAVRRTFTKGGLGPLRLALAGAGRLADLRSIPGPRGEVLRAILAPSATEWVSLTPFVPPRHLKRRGRHTLEGQVAEELASRGLPPLQELQVLDPCQDKVAARHRHFVRIRRFGPPPPVDCWYSLRLVLSSPAQGPLCLGYGGHFGLGIFRSP